MMKVITGLTVLALYVASTSAFMTVTSGYCPVVKTKPDFELDRYLGLWFSYKNFDVPYQVGLDCVSALYSRGPRPGVIRVVNSGKRRIKIGDKYQVMHTTRAVGEAIIVDPDVPGGLRVSFGSMTDFMGDDANYNILDTDYETFSVVYSCFDLKIIPLRIESAWILTREAGAPPANLDQLYANLTSQGTDPGLLRPINFDQCWKSS